jgi:hypothetical protein
MEKKTLLRTGFNTNLHTILIKMFTHFQLVIRGVLAPVTAHARTLNPPPPLTPNKCPPRGGGGKKIIAKFSPFQTILHSTTGFRDYYLGENLEF